MSNVALAIKYRPRNFETLVGQEVIAQTLSFAISEKRLVHAYLFSGLRGSGKTSTARIFAKALNCEKGPISTPCEECDSCKNANKNAHPDVIEMDAASNRKIDDIRDLIEHTKYAPSMGKFKIFIIDEVHMLTKEAYNALLKTLEEPPEYVKFILATTDPLKIPQTIISRTQHFKFKKIPNRIALLHLKDILSKEGVEKYEEEALELLIREGKGSMRDTLTFLDQAISFSNNDIKTEVISNMLGVVNTSKISELLDAILSKEKEKVIKKVDELEEFEANAILDEMIAFLKDRLLNSDVRFNTFMLDRFFRIINDSKILLNINSDEYFVLVLTFMKMQEATKLMDIDKKLEDMENRGVTPSPAPKREKEREEKEIVQPSSLPTQEPTTPPKENIEQISENMDTTDTVSEDIDDFMKLKIKISDRNAKLGEIFEEGVSFVSFEENTLTLKSAIADADKPFMNQHFSIIKDFIKDIYNTDKLNIKKEANSGELSEEDKRRAIEEAVGIKKIEPIEKS